MRQFVNLWVVLGAIALAAALSGIVFVWVISSRPTPVSKGAPTAVILVIPAPTATPVIPTPILLNTPTPTPTDPPPPTGGPISIGAYVQVSGTGTDGVRLRAEPGFSGDTLFFGMEAEVFQVIDGPRDADGYTWWHLVAPYEVTRQGWAVSNYLAVFQNP
jgi:hypothetical protein